MMANYKTNFPSFTKTFCFNGVALFVLFPNCLLGFLNFDLKLLLMQNHLLLITEIYIYNFRRSELLILSSLIREIAKVKNIEEKFQ